MKIFVASDHAGFHLKQKVVAHLRAQAHEVQDMGPQTDERVDYPDFAVLVGRAVRDAAGSLGILVCGSGIGMCITANKVRGVRAAEGSGVESARLARAHNDANVLCVGQRLVPPDTALAIADVFLKTPFDGGRHTARVQKIADLEHAEAVGALGAVDKPARSTL